MESFSPDPYKILDIPRNATERRIKRAYRRLAKKLHPDRNPGDPKAEERFKQVQWAYETLKRREGQEAVSALDLKQKRYATTFSRSTDPFCSFFEAMRTYHAKSGKRKPLVDREKNNSEKHSH